MTAKHTWEWFCDSGSNKWCTYEPRWEVSVQVLFAFLECVTTFRCKYSHINLLNAQFVGMHTLSHTHTHAQTHTYTHVHTAYNCISESDKSIMAHVSIELTSHDTQL